MSWGASPWLAEAHAAKCFDAYLVQQLRPAPARLPEAVTAQIQATRHILRGLYSSNQVQELARVLTGVGVNLQTTNLTLKPDMQGYYLRRGLFEFNAARHDFSDKQLLGQPLEQSKTTARFYQSLGDNSTWHTLGVPFSRGHVIHRSATTGVSGQHQRAQHRAAFKPKTIGWQLP